MKILPLFITALLFGNADIAIAEGDHDAVQTKFMPDDNDPLANASDANDSKAESKATDDSDNLVEIDLRRYLVGGGLGTVFGFGIGHAVQRRYGQDLGWIYTAGEIGSLALMGTGFTYAGKCEEGEGERQDKCVGRGELMALAGYLLFTGLRVAEIINVWLPSEERYIIVDTEVKRSKLSVLPVFNTQSLGLALVTPL